jgi:hypothetical protein
LRPRPEDAPVGLGDGHVVDAGFPAHHVTVGVELPQFVAVTAEPLAGRVAGLVLETHRDPVAVEGPQVLAQGVVEFAGPLAAQELRDLGPAGDEFVPVAPDRVLAVGARDALRVTGVPGVFSGLDLLPGGFLGERRQWRSRCHATTVPGF